MLKEQSTNTKSTERLAGQGFSEGVERIEFGLPLKKKYVSLLRLVVSGICLRSDCTYDTIEDIKLAVDEAFLLAIKQNGIQFKEILISFVVSGDMMEIEVPFIAQKPSNNSMGLFLIRSLTDEVTLTDESGVTILKMKKVLREKG
jgi:serine/threonine-protein kinase RsbW